MESTISKSLGSSSSLNPLILRLHHHLSKAPPQQRLTLPSRLIAHRLTCIYANRLRRPNFASLPAPPPSPPAFRTAGTAAVPSRALRCISSSASPFASVGGNGGGFGGESGGGGGGGPDSGDAKSKSVGAAAAEEASAVPSDVIILDVTGMTCGGCAASVKRILESQAQVSSASVNLTTETAVVWPVSEAKAVPDWQKDLGEALAKHLTNCGFTSTLRDAKGDKFFKVFERKMEEKRERLKESGRQLAVSWALCAVCLVGHFSHFLGTKSVLLHVMHSTAFHLSLSLCTLIGPGRQLIVDGVKSLLKGAPNMNTLVGLGALSSFSVSALAAFIPKLGWKAFFEEPIMLIAFVLLGRNLEQRAKIKATSDMTGLLSILPSKARLLVDADEGNPGSTVEVSCNSLSIGDQIVILPGDRVPVDGVVTAGRSTVDESSFTGEPLPVTKLPGSEVAAGSINLNGTLRVQVQRPGGETAMADIVRLVEEAQGSEAPVQRLADKVSGHFTYGVMALSAATFMFWNLFGSRVLPPVLHQGSPLSLALQLSCSVLEISLEKTFSPLGHTFSFLLHLQVLFMQVVACPCALGLATPTAVLVGTSLGATRGLLLRGGNILEKFAMVDTVVLDKTGTLTVGKPVVTEVVTPGVTDLRQDSTPTWSAVEILQLASAVESNTVHPVAKAITEAARVRNCPKVKIIDGTFMEEPGSGAVAFVEDKKVSVGNLEWIQRNGVNGDLHCLEPKNQSVVYVGVDNNLAGMIYIEDQIREDAAHVVETLSNRGIDVYMLSGDKKSTAEYVASVVGIPKDKVLSGVKPDQKKRFINGLQQDKRIVAMIGDGINDAAALASSDVGVAMGGGVGAASEVSSIVLMGNRLSQVLDALELSRLTMKTVKQNLWWAFGYNIVGIPIAAGVLLPVTGTMLTPSIAGALMGLSSVGVMANSLLLRLRFSSKQSGKPSSSDLKSCSSSDLENQKERRDRSLSGATWKGT